MAVRGNCVCVVFAAAPFGSRCVTVALGFLRREGTPDMARRCQNARPGLCCQLQGASIEPDSSVCHQVTPTHWGRKTRSRTRKVFNWLKCATIHKKNKRFGKKAEWTSTCFLHILCAYLAVAYQDLIWYFLPQPWARLSACLWISLMQSFLSSSSRINYLHWL